jgi:polyisoprenoid-binding protein YceI
MATGTRTTWQIDPAHTEVGFEVKHLMISKVRGGFGAVSGTIELDEAEVGSSSATAEIEVASIDTREPQRDAHLRSADFFDAENFPKITFRSTRVARAGGERLEVVGDLTIRGVTREVTLAVEEEGRAKDPWGGERVGFSATGRIDRRDFGLTWNQALETGGVLVANEIRLVLNVQAVKAAAEQAA